MTAQLSHLSIALHLGVIENGAFAIAYDSEARNRTQRLARRRDATLDFGKLLSEENDEAERYLKSIDLGKGRGPGPGKGKGQKGSDPRKGGNGKPSGVNKGETPPTVLNAAPKRTGKGGKRGKLKTYFHH